MIPGLPPTLSFLNTMSQTKALNQDGNIYGRIIIKPSVFLKGISVLVISQANIAPRAKANTETSAPIPKVFNIGMYSKDPDISPTVVESQWCNVKSPGTAPGTKSRALH